MDGLRSTLDSGFDDGVGPQVALGWRGWTDAHREVGCSDVACLRIGVAEDRDGLDAELVAGADDPHRDLASIGDEHPGEWRPVVFAQRRLGVRSRRRCHSGMLPCFLRRVGFSLAGKHLKGGDEPRSRLGRNDDVVDVAPRRGDVRVRELGLVFSDEATRAPHCGSPASAIRSVEDDVDRALDAHDGDLALSARRSSCRRGCACCS